MLDRLKRLVHGAPGTPLQLKWLKEGGWLGAHLTGSVPQAPRKKHIEAAASATNQMGPQKLAPEYGEPGAERNPGAVRSSAACGDLYAWLVQSRRTSTIIEFGAAFGVSGMYFAAGLDAAGCGHLYSFEINCDWGRCRTQHPLGLEPLHSHQRGVRRPRGRRRDGPH